MNSTVVNRYGLGEEDLYPRDLFDQITDLLADLVLNDIKRYPQPCLRPSIDRANGQENTALHTQELME